MVKLRKNLFVEGLIGAVNKQLVLKQYGKITVVSSYPDMSRVVKTEKQKKENSRFRDAVAYAKSQMVDPVFKAEYQKKVKGLQKAFNIAIADFYNPPEITKVNTSAWKGHSGDTITIHAIDDFRVERVEVEISDDKGTLLEMAAARQMNGAKWECALQKEYTGGPFHIKVSAWDKPGNLAAWEQAGELGRLS